MLQSMLKREDALVIIKTVFNLALKWNAKGGRKNIEDLSV